MPEQSKIETIADLYIYKISLLSIEEQQEIQNRLIKILTKEPESEILTKEPESEILTKRTRIRN